MFLKIFICLWTYSLCSTVVAVSSPEVIKLWEDAAQAVKYFPNSEHCRALHNQLKGKVAPHDFSTVHQPKKGEWESTIDFENRMLIPDLLCSVGWEGTLFLMSQTKVFQTYFAQQTPPPSLRRHLNKKHLTQHFTNIETAATNGQLGAVLCFIHYGSSSNEWQMGFVNGFFKYCQTSGYTDFTKYVFDNNDIFFSERRNQFLYSLQGKCFIAALRKNDYGISIEEEIKKFNKLPLNAEYVDEVYQDLVDISYVELAKKELYDGMDIVLDCNSWPQPSSEAKLAVLQIINSTLHKALMQNNYSRAKEMLTRKTANKPEQNTLDAFTADAANKKKWTIVDGLLTNMYDESRPVPQAVTDDLFVYAVAYENDKYFGLLTGEEWAYAPPSPAAFDRGLLETVRFRYQDTFNRFLGRYSEKLSEAGMKAALEQAGKPGVNASLYDCLDTLVYPGSVDNHYQECLKKKLGIATKRELMFPGADLNFEPIKINTIDIASFFVPITDADNITTDAAVEVEAEAYLPT